MTGRSFSVVLCAVFLMTAVGSGLGALFLTESNLYRQTPEEVYSESRDTLAEVFARQIASNYLSQTLGECPEEITENYVHFNAGYYSYVLKDPEGNVLKSREADMAAPTGEAHTYSFPISGQYMELVSATPLSQLNITMPTEPPTYLDLEITDNIHVDGTWVNQITFIDRLGNAAKYEDANLGVLNKTPSGNVYFQAADPAVRLTAQAELVHAVFSFDGAVLFEIHCDEGIGDATVDESGLLSIVFHKKPNTPTVYDEEYEVYDAIPQNGADVRQIHVTYYNGSSESLGSDGTLGVLKYLDDGRVVFEAKDPGLFLSHTGPVSSIAFIGIHSNLLYEAVAQSGGVVGEITQDENGRIRYQSLLGHLDTASRTQNTEPPVATTEVPEEFPHSLFNAIPEEETAVSSVAYMDHNDASINTFSIRDLAMQNNTGVVSLAPDGSVVFATSAPSPVKPDGDTFYYVAFYNMEGVMIYEAQNKEGVGTFSLDENNHLHFTSSMEVTPVSPVTENPTEPITIPDTTTATTEVTIPVNIPTETIVAELLDPTEGTEPAVYHEGRDYTYTSYFDHKLGEEVEVKFIEEPIPEGYTVDLVLYPGAYEMDQVYDLILQIWIYRNELLYLLGASLLGFAITAVYLCCAAGRKSGSDQIQPLGLNAMSLDLYLGIGGFAICVLAVTGFEGGYYLLRYSPQLLAPFAVIMSFAAALIVVGFCFACTAQLKTPNGYWWRNTVTARCVKLGIRFLRWFAKAFIRFMHALEAFGHKAFPWLGLRIRRCWKLFIRFCLASYRYTEKFLIRLGKGIGKIAKRTHAWLHAFLSLLPVTWQWLLVGFGMLLLMALVFATNGEELLVVLCLGVCVAIILYGAHCFGLLLDSTKHMSKGDLETKVDDKLMIGSFKEFAADLNALGDVAVIAAQKQMKSERMKTELITNVSHDIKTPLTSIINYVDLLQKPHTDEEQEIYLEVLSRQSLRMKKLLEDLIDMSKANTGNMAVNAIRINAAETVNQALGEFADKLDKAHLTMVVQQPEEPLYMYADGRLAWRVLSNLLSNTVKYALPGTRVYIDIAEDGDQVRISMKNISREPLNVSAEELMERFIRGDASRNTEGSGLGLNIAQSLMEVQRGKLHLTMDGDLFKVTLTFPRISE